MDAFNRIIAPSIHICCCRCIIINWIKWKGDTKSILSTYFSRCAENMCSQSEMAVERVHFMFVGCELSALLCMHIMICVCGILRTTSDWIIVWTRIVCRWIHFQCITQVYFGWVCFIQMRWWFVLCDAVELLATHITIYQEFLLFIHSTKQ